MSEKFHNTEHEVVIAGEKKTAHTAKHIDPANPPKPADKKPAAAPSQTKPAVV
jgi:hypothetical protein